jgi:hypothetical protein
MTAEHLRRYFEWLLKVRSTVFPQSATLTLQGEFDPSQVGGDIGEIRSLRVTGSALPLSVQRAADAPETSTKFKKVVRETAKRIIDSNRLNSRRFGYRRLFIMLRAEGEPSGINRIYRLYREEGLAVRKRRSRIGVRSPSSKSACDSEPA